MSDRADSTQPENPVPRDPSVTETVPPPSPAREIELPSPPRVPREFGGVKPEEREIRITMTTREFAEIAGRIIAEKFAPVMMELAHIGNQQAATQAQIATLLEAHEERDKSDLTNWTLVRGEVNGARQDVQRLIARFDDFETRLTAAEKSLGSLASRVAAIEIDRRLAQDDGK